MMLDNKNNGLKFVWIFVRSKPNLDVDTDI